MSFLGGPECSTGANPLAQFQKQTGADTSLQRDRLTSRGPQSHGFRSPLQNNGEDAAFLDFQQQQGPGPQLDFEGPGLLRPSARENGWAGEFAQHAPSPLQSHFPAGPEQLPTRGFSPQDFAQFMQREQSASPASFQQQQQPQPQSMYQRPPMYGSNFGGGMGMGMGMQRPMFGGAAQFNTQQEQPMYAGKGKGRVQELSDTDWEAQFEALSSEDQREVGDVDAEAEKAMEEELDELDRSETGFGDFESIWKGIQAEADDARQMMSDEDITKHLGDEFDQWKDFDGLSHDFDGLRTHEQFTGRPEFANYLFEENNLFKDVPNAFEEGQKILREGGNLSLAALAFEAAVQKQPDFVDAWTALGQAQAQNEKESPAIRALEQALKLDPNNLDALMGLSVSYTNEGYDSLAYRTLERWVGVRYPQLGITPRGLEEEEELGFTDRHILHEKVTGLFLDAAQLNPEGADVDVDVQVGLGVLFYGSEDYEKAIDCFNAALNSHQHGSMKREGEEHLLWNRLGATLANSNHSEEAIEAYTRALELRPNFVRARYNLGVSCINLGVLEQAAGHLLGALSMHKVIESEGRAKAAELLDGDVDDRVVEGLLQQNQSTNLYDTLRRVFTQMGRRDLAEIVGPDMSLEGMRGKFDF